MLRCMMPPGRNRPYLSEKGRSTTTAPPGAARSGHTAWHEQTGVWHGGAARTMEQSWFFPCIIFSFSSPIQTRPQERRAGKRGEATSLPLSWNMYAVPARGRAGHDRDIHGGEANGIGWAAQVCVTVPAGEEGTDRPTTMWSR